MNETGCQRTDIGGVKSLANRKRKIKLEFRVDDHELEVIQEKMKVFGTTNREAYLRKMAMDGYLIQLDLPGFKEMLSLMRRCSNNLNQVAARANAAGHIYKTDLDELQQQQDQIMLLVRDLTLKTSKVL